MDDLQRSISRLMVINISPVKRMKIIYKFYNPSCLTWKFKKIFMVISTSDNKLHIS